MTYPDLVNVARTFTALDIELPEEFNRAVAVLAAGMTAASANPSYDLLSQFDAGTLTPESVGPEVLKAAVALIAKQAAHGIMRDIENPLCKHARKAIRAGGDELIGQLRTPFNSAAEGMMAAAAMFAPDATGEDVLSQGAEASEAWRSLTAHAHTLELVNSVRVQLMLFGYGVSEHRAALFCSGVDNEQAMAAANQAYLWPTGGRGGRFFDVAALGFELHLNLASETAAIDSAVRANVTARAADRARGPRMTEDEQRGAEKELRIIEQVGPAKVRA